MLRTSCTLALLAGTLALAEPRVKLAQVTLLNPDANATSSVHRIGEYVKRLTAALDAELGKLEPLAPTALRLTLVVKPGRRACGSRTWATAAWRRSWSRSRSC